MQASQQRTAIPSELNMMKVKEVCGLCQHFGLQIHCRRWFAPAIMRPVGPVLKSFKASLADPASHHEVPDSSSAPADCQPSLVLSGC